MTDYTPNDIPTEGDCYQASVQNADELERLQKADAAGQPEVAEIALQLHLREGAIAVVHGWVTPPGGPAAGKRIHHAWIEVSNYVIETQGGTRRLMPKQAYYTLFSAEAEKAYRLDEARRLSAAYGFGRWTKIDTQGVHRPLPAQGPI